MNNIFLKNLTALATKNPDLVKKLQGYIPTEVPQLIQKNGAYNLLYKNKLIHNEQSPLGEAQEIFAHCNNEPVSIHLIYGLGLGYLFQVVSINSKGTVILYEPDLNILWFAFTLVDFSNDIMKQNVFITNTMEEVLEAVYKKSGMKNLPELISLTSQREIYSDDFEILVQKLKETIGSYALDLKYTKEKFYPALRMLTINIPNILKEIPLTILKDAYKGKTAIIISAGPTLDKNIETIKKYRDRFILFTVGTAVKTLYKHNIKPDFLCIIETFDSTKQIEGIDLSEVNLITEPYSHPYLRNYKYKNIYSHISANMPINHFWANIAKLNIDEYWSKGTVSYTALNCARLLGCSKIILVGQDLAYIEGQCYSKDSAYKDLVCTYNENDEKWEITAKNFEAFANALSTSEDLEERKNMANRRLANLNKSLYYVKGIQGNMIPTESVYSAFIKPLSEYTEKFNDREYINTSLVGAQIDGFTNMSLEDALKNEKIIDNVELESNFEYDKCLIKENLKKEIDILKIALNKIDEAQNAAKNLANDIKRYKSVTTEVLKSLKKVSTIYLFLSSDFSEQSKIFDFSTTSEKIDLDYEMKMTKEFTLENITRINNLITTYLDTAQQRIIDIENIITQNIGEM